MDFRDVYHLPGLPEEPGFVARKINQVLGKLGFHIMLSPRPNQRVNMHTIEQRSNFYDLALYNLSVGIPGRWVEFGCFTGQSAMVFQKMLGLHRPGERIMLYDRFKASYASKGDIKELLVQNFRNNKLADPEIVEGDFYETIPSELPAQIGLAHIDCGTGADQEVQKKRMLWILENIYGRLSKGAIVFLMDYHDPSKTVKGYPSNTGVKASCDEFFRDKQEKIHTLFGNQYSHGFFIKL